MTPRAMSPKSPDGSSDTSSECNYLRNALCLAVFSAMVAGLIWPAAAQRYSGRNSTPSVTVDYSVLDELGPAPNVPQLILQNPTGSAYRNNPYRSRPRFPVISNTNDRVRTKRLVLTPPMATNRRTSRKPARKAVRPASPPISNRVVRRAPTIKQPPVARKPRTLTPPPPRIAATQPRKIMTPSVAKLDPAPSKAPGPPPLPPVSTAAKPKQIARTVAPPPPAPPNAAMQPPPATRKVVKSRTSAARRVPKAEPARAKPKQVASLSKSTASVRSGSLRRIEFPPGSAKLSNKAALGLKNVAAALSNDTGLRIQLLAYAGRNNDSASQSRRLSLSRALAARSKLIDQGVRSTRIDVRALGNKSAGGPADRIDIIVTKR